MGNHRAERAPKRRTSAPAAPLTGKRRATTPPRRSVIRSLPSLPLVAGVAVLAISAGGAVTASGADTTSLTSSGSTFDAGAAIGAAGTALSRRGEIVSRDGTRDAGAEVSDP